MLPLHITLTQTRPNPRSAVCRSTQFATYITAALYGQSTADCTAEGELCRRTYLAMKLRLYFVYIWVAQGLTAAHWLIKRWCFYVIPCSTTCISLLTSITKFCDSTSLQPLNANLAHFARPNSILLPSQKILTVCIRFWSSSSGLAISLKSTT